MSRAARGPSLYKNYIWNMVEVLLARDKNPASRLEVKLKIEMKQNQIEEE